MKRNVALLFGLLALVASCDVLEQVAGVDSVENVVRDNPVDSQSSRPLNVLVSLVDGSTVETVRPVLPLPSAASVVAYRLQVASDPDFATLVVDQPGLSAPGYRLAVSLSNHVTYFWRLKPRFMDGTESGWSQSWSFAVELPVPVPEAEPVGSIRGTPFPMLNWQGFEGAQSYEVQYGAEQTFPETATTSATTSSSFRLSQGVPDGTTLKWRVRALIDGSFGEWCTPVPISIRLAKPLLNGPGPSSEIHDLTFSWFDIEGPYYGPPIPEYSGFELELSGSSDFSLSSLGTKSVSGGPGQSQTTYWETWDGELELTKTYFWRVRCVYENGIRGPWSGVRSFVRDRISKIFRPLGGVSLPLVAVDGAYFSSKRSGENLAKYNLEGELAWSTSAGVPLMIGADGICYAVSPSPVPDYLLKAVDPEGSVLWSLPKASGETLIGAVLTQNGEPLVLVRTDFDYTTSRAQPATMVLYKVEADGTAITLFSRETSDTWSYSWGNIAPVVGTDGSILLGAFKVLYSLGQDGTVNWSNDISTASDRSLTPTPNGGVIVTNYSTYSMASLDAFGNEKWSKDGAFTRPVVDSEGVAYVQGADSGNFGTHAIRDDGTTKWFSPFSGFSPILGDDGTLYLRSSELIALATEDGQVRWTCEVSTTWGTQMDGEGNLLVDVGYGSIAVIPTSSGGVDPKAPWPMTGADPQGTRNASF